MLNSAVNLISFAAVLWLITPRLVLAAVGYAAFGTVASILLGKRLVPLNFLQLKKEADFRFRLIQVRENDEAIALQAAEPWESAGWEGGFEHWSITLSASSAWTSD